MVYYVQGVVKSIATFSQATIESDAQLIIIKSDNGEEDKDE
jgi:hypothetical protein